MPEYHGEYYDYEGFVVEPAGRSRPDMPIWIGGRTSRSLRRAVELGDGWVPFGLSGPTTWRRCSTDARTTDAWDARTTPLDIALRPGDPRPDR